MDRQEYYSTNGILTSETILDVTSSLSKPSNNGEIICDGVGNILVYFSFDGKNYGDGILIKQYEFLEYKDQQVRLIKLVPVNDSSYRVNAY